MEKENIHPNDQRNDGHRNNHHRSRNRNNRQPKELKADTPIAEELSQEENLKEPIENLLPDESDDNIATAEDVAAYAREAAEKRAKKSKISEIDEATNAPVDQPEINNSIDPYLEPDPDMPKVEYKESIFLSRGCNHCPTSYVPVKEQELRSCCKVGASNWMKGIRQPMANPFDVVEVRFKNNRKDFYRLPDGIDVNEGDVVAVEGIPGHDIGIVSLIGEACRIQMRRKKIDPESENIKKLFRRAKALDIEKWIEALNEEHEALIKTRKISEDLGLVMKVNDVEFQGDRSKAIFYYTAEDRVDFRSLIKVLAEEFKVRVEMKQIGVRQEAGKVGGIGTCGRELCCSTWLTNFKSVTTGVAKAQQILPNPQKLAGQCGKLKCCLNFEYEVYVDALKKFPPANTPIRFQKGLALYKKTDVFRGIMWYAYEGENELHALKAETIKEIIEMNRNQQYPEQMEDFQVELMSTTALAQESSADEFEKELKRMADAAEEQPSEARNNRHDDRRGDRGNRRERGERPERNDRRDGRRNERKDRPDRREENNQHKSNNANDNQERPDRPQRQDRPDRHERSARRNNNERRR